VCLSPSGFHDRAMGAAFGSGATVFGASTRQILRHIEQFWPNVPCQSSRRNLSTNTNWTHSIGDQATRPSRRSASASPAWYASHQDGVFLLLGPVLRHSHIVGGNASVGKESLSGTPSGRIPPGCIGRRDRARGGGHIGRPFLPPPLRNKQSLRCRCPPEPPP